MAASGASRLKLGLNPLPRILCDIFRDGAKP